MSCSFMALFGDEFVEVQKGGFLDGAVDAINFGVALLDDEIAGLDGVQSTTPIPQGAVIGVFFVADGMDMARGPCRNGFVGLVLPGFDGGLSFGFEFGHRISGV